MYSRENAQKGEAHEALLSGAQQEGRRFLGEFGAWPTGCRSTCVGVHALVFVEVWLGFEKFSAVQLPNFKVLSTERHESARRMVLQFCRERGRER